MIEWNVRNLQTVFARKIQKLYGKITSDVATNNTCNVKESVTWLCCKIMGKKGILWLFSQKIMSTMEILRTKEVECQMGYCIVTCVFHIPQNCWKNSVYSFFGNFTDNAVSESFTWWFGWFHIHLKSMPTLFALKVLSDNLYFNLEGLGWLHYGLHLAVGLLTFDLKDFIF
jgi:hypothetical protein